MNLAEAKKFLAKNQVKSVLAQFVDIHGTAKAKAVPVAHFEDILNAGAGFAGFAVWGLGIEPHGPDYMAVGDLDTLSLVPWQPGYARIVCDGHVHGKPWDYDARVTLKKQVARLQQQGLTFMTGLEPEFSLLKRSVTGKIEPCEDSDTLAKPCYDYKGLSRSRAFLDRLVESLRRGRHRRLPDRPRGRQRPVRDQLHLRGRLTSCDHYIFFKMASAEIASEMGLICSFMPKPFANRPGNGMHMHMSMADGKKNLFQDKKRQARPDLSPMAYHFLGGLLKHTPPRWRRSARRR
jgi:glutamine synthetase